MNVQHDHSTPTNPPEAAPDRARTDRVAILGVLLSLAMVALISLHVASRPVAAPRDTIRSVVDADDAPWWELTVLPRIGPTLAGEIVRYRESFQTEMSLQTHAADNAGLRVFSKAVDLMKVRGIGPKTVERIKRDLDFGDD